MTEAHFGLATPTTLWGLDWAHRQEQLQQIEVAGFDHVFLADHVSFHNGAGADGFVEAASLAQLHPSLKVMISIYLLPLRHPLPVARQIASMARTAPGRFIFGVGIGGEDPHELAVCGVNPKHRGRRANESLTIIKGLLAGDTVSFEGSDFQVQDARIRPTPSQPVPIIVGGRSDAALTRAARFADGWIGVWCSPKRFHQAVTMVAEEAEALGRAPIAWLHGYQPWVGVDATSPDRAREAVKNGMEAFYKIPL
jgi:alkanesulfonate monooxygenase SsuD/methylene tetrahydromethanopterin reductase-like flavin-dependent oxidoreductase (luciferase family)